MKDYLESLEIGEGKVKLSSEEIKAILAEHGKTVTTETDKVKQSLNDTISNYQSQLKTANDTIQSYKDMDIIVSKNQLMIGKQNMKKWKLIKKLKKKRVLEMKELMLFLMTLNLQVKVLKQE